MFFVKKSVRECESEDNIAINDILAEESPDFSTSVPSVIVMSLNDSILKPFFSLVFVEIELSDESSNHLVMYTTECLHAGVKELSFTPKISLKSEMHAVLYINSQTISHSNL